MFEHVSAKKIRELDNKMTYAIGYRNLYNIVVLSCGAVMLILSTVQTSHFEVVSIGFVVFLLGAKWSLDQMYANIDTISVSETVSPDDPII